MRVCTHTHTHTQHALSHNHTHNHRHVTWAALTPISRGCRWAHLAHATCLNPDAALQPQGLPWAWTCTLPAQQPKSLAQ